MDTTTILTPPPVMREETTTSDEFGSRWRPFCLSLPDNSAYSDYGSEDDLYKTPSGVSQYDETIFPSDLLPFKSCPPELVSPSCSLYSSGVSTPNSAPFSPLYATTTGSQDSTSFIYGNHLDKSDYFSDPLLEDKYLHQTTLKFSDDSDFTSHNLDFSSLAQTPACLSAPPSSAPQVRTPISTGTNPYYTPTFAPRRSASSISTTSRCSTTTTSSSNACATSRTCSPSLNLDSQAALAHSRSRSEAFLLSRSCSPCSVPDALNSLSGSTLHRRMMSLPSVNEADLNPDGYFNFSQLDESPYTTLDGGLALLESTTSVSCSNTDYSSNDESLRVPQEYAKKAPPPMRRLTGDDPPVDSSKPHCCKLCDRSFKRQEHLRRHLRTHTNERPYACSVPGCKRKFSRRDNLRAHIKTHTRRGGRNGYVEGLDPSSLAKD